MKALNCKMDELLQSEFKEKYWDEWVAFCRENGYDPEQEWED